MQPSWVPNRHSGGEASCSQRAGHALQAGSALRGKRQGTACRQGQRRQSLLSGPTSGERRRARPETQASAEYELRVCTNKTCKKQGSEQIAKFGEDLALEEVKVKRTGCLGSCGSGPNAVLLPDEVFLSHLGTPAKLAQVLQGLCNAGDLQPVVKATELRLAGNAAARDGDMRRAEALYTEALEAGGARGRHLALANRSGARLALGDAHGAAADAEAAAAAAPPSFTTALIRQAEAYSHLQDYRKAAAALDEAARRDPSFGASRDYKAASRQLAEYMQKSR